MKKRVSNLFRPGIKEFKDSGLSNLVGSQSNRLVNPDGSFNIIRTGIPKFADYSVIHELMAMSWLRFLVFVFCGYFILNFLFGLIYFLIGMEQFMGPIATGNLEQFQEAYFFSTQTLATVGYGRMNPIGLGANLVASIESMIGIVVIAIVTGLVYGRFSRPVIRLKFSTNALISPYKEGNALMFRLANAKRNDMSDVEAQVMLSMVLYEDGKFMRRYYNLELERRLVNSLSLSWTLVHPINDNSPLANFDAQLLEEYEAEVMVTVKGFDPTFSQVVQTRTSFHHSQIIWNARFTPTFRRSDDGHNTILELDHINDFEVLEIAKKETITT